MEPQKPRLISGTPVKPSKKTARGNRGRADVHGKPVDYRSTLERDLLFLLDIDPTVAEVVAQPVTFRYRRPGTGRMADYTPDFHVRHVGADPREILYQVKHRADLCEAYREHKGGWMVARREAREHGMTHRIITDKEIRGPFLANAWILKRFKRIDPDEGLEERLAATLATLGPSTPAALLAAAFWSRDNQAKAIPHMWRMVAHGRIIADLRAPLTMSSPITIILGEGYAWTDPYSSR